MNKIKIKWTILTLAILFSLGSAFATRPRATFGTLYYWTGSGYAPAGTLGVNYVCESSPNTCTYTLSGGVYTPYQTASNYTPIGITAEPSKTAKKENSK